MSYTAYLLHHLIISFPDHQFYPPVASRFRRRTMCDRIWYQKRGDQYECFRISGDGCKEFLGKGTKEEISTWLSTHGLGFVRQDVLLQDIELLCDEKPE